MCKTQVIHGGGEGEQEELPAREGVKPGSARGQQGASERVENRRGRTVANSSEKRSGTVTVTWQLEAFGALGLGALMEDSQGNQAGER